MGCTHRKEMYLSHVAVVVTAKEVMTIVMRITHSINKCLAMSFLLAIAGNLEAQIIYNWQDSKEGWVPASETNLGCNLVEQPEAMAMRAFNTTPVMRSGTLSESLNIDASDFDRVRITLKNPTSSGNPNARLFAYPPESNTFMCHWNVPVDTSMTEFQTYTLDLTTSPNPGSGDFVGEVGRFGWRGPWGVANGDTIFWKTMVVYNSIGCTNSEACNYAPFAEEDNGLCVLVGDSCDDGNPATLDDMISADCLCVGETDYVENHSEDKALTLGPNPASSSVNVTSSQSLGRVRVMDVQGRVWLTEDTRNNSIVLDVSALAVGSYFVETNSSQGRMLSRLMVNR